MIGSRAEPLRARRRGRWMALVLVALIFLLGILVGVLGTHLFYAERLRRPGAVADWVVDAGARQLSGRLQLDQEQQEELGRNLETTRGEIRELRREIIRRLKEIRSQAIARLIPILDESQREELRHLHESEGRYLDRYLNQAEDEESESESGLTEAEQENGD